ncbi:DUF6301 family protein [Actinomadura sp. HBU206391]|uniref:DUF6301 family protein n=1 Tax=Actinomadura sp. HBU206391 TaxID=2731692 RepID=UPI00164FDC84|nr:DUF6301 family protein [Actinomadura sp. HBU206391]MBC6460511.1 hypothetical protein [Actinomadura sp. HBU206391]
MADRRMLPASEVADLVTGLRSLRWAWDPVEIDGVVERFGWKVESRLGRSVRLDAGFGMASGFFYLSRSGKVDRISVAACGSASAESAGGRAYVQDAFAQVVAAATRALGEPTERIPGESAEVRWRGHEATIGVKHQWVQVNVFLATNEYIDEFDRAVELGI